MPLFRGRVRTLRQQPSRFRGVRRNLRDELVDRIELALRPQKRVQHEREFAAVQVAVEIEQMGFQLQLAARRVERRANADVQLALPA